MEPSRPKGGIDRRVVVVLSSALGIALLTIAFLVGRIAAHPQAVVQDASAPASTSSSTTAVAQPIDRGEAPAPAASRPPEAPPQIAIPSGATETPRTLSPAVTAPSNDRGAIAAYFASVERFDDAGIGDPNDFAKSLVDGATSGDYSGFDSLLAKARRQRDVLRGLQAPPACASHHRLALSLSESSVAMLEKLRKALAGGDPTALMSMMGEARDLESQAAQLKTMTEAIKRGAGLQ
jgi:hypothetical protein